MHYGMSNFLAMLMLINTPVHLCEQSLSAAVLFDKGYQGKYQIQVLADVVMMATIMLNVRDT